MFLWGTLQENRTAGCDDVSQAPPSPGTKKVTAYPKADIKTTLRDDAISVSKLYFEAPQPAFWGKGSYLSPYFNFHDLYGNKSGNIHIIVNEEDTQSFHLEDA
ncbi:hypothetical protein [Xenorhabdus sp. IM139775]|uniref:hypothetical protein n=1 Tax=Xenorhabdus sp. IM139775 TaxID=3025876 RepID=UPI002358AE3A|nr:hypothetical protein [Xenorhabdus sp. IM139775]MDC9592698.1 hypothetical protein [Xenorhabdus sp. IM139775]